MAMLWTVSAQRDLARLYGFLAPVDESAARRTVALILSGVRRLAAHPRLGVPLAKFGPREVRRLIVSGFELRYEIRDGDLFILRVWHSREDR